MTVRVRGDADETEGGRFWRKEVVWSKEDSGAEFSCTFGMLVTLK